MMSDCTKCLHFFKFCLLFSNALLFLQDLFTSTLKPVEKVLKDGDVRAKDIDEIVLIGGSTRIPKVQQLVKDFFNGKVILHGNVCMRLKGGRNTRRQDVLKLDLQNGLTKHNVLHFIYNMEEKKLCCFGCLAAIKHLHLYFFFP